MAHRDETLSLSSKVGRGYAGTDFTVGSYTANFDMMTLPTSSAPSLMVVFFSRELGCNPKRERATNPQASWWFASPKGGTPCAEIMGLVSNSQSGVCMRTSPFPDARGNLQATSSTTLPQESPLGEHQMKKKDAEKIGFETCWLHLASRCGEQALTTKYLTAPITRQQLWNGKEKSRM